MVLEDVLLRRKSTPMREEKLRRLERQALYEECLCAFPISPWQHVGGPRGRMPHPNPRKRL